MPLKVGTEASSISETNSSSEIGEISFCFKFKAKGF